MKDIEKKINIPESSSENETLKAFWGEIVALKDAEMAKEQEYKEHGGAPRWDPHFDFINPEELTELEADVYGKFKNKTLTLKEFDLARNHARSEIPEGKKYFTDSRINFYEYLANKMQNKEWMERFNRERKQ